MGIPFLDLKKVNAMLEDEIREAIASVIESGWYILGKAGEQYEADFKRRLVGNDEGYVVGCNSGTDALRLSLLAAGVGHGDDVITVSNTAIPTISAIYSVGAKPSFVDVDSETWVMDLAQVTTALTSKSKAIIPVHLYGNMVNVNFLKRIVSDAGRNDVVIIEDVAQAHGATLSGHQAGSLGDFGAFSFHPSKNIGALGDGGAVFCRALALSHRLKSLRNYGQTDRYRAEILYGINSRLDEIQAAILTVKLKYMDEWNENKSELMNLYKKELSTMPIKFQKITDGCKPGWHLCVIALENKSTRDAAIAHLKRQNIETLIHYPIPIHRQKPFMADATRTLPITDNLADRILSLPMNTAIAKEDVEKVVDALQLFFK